MRSPIKFNNNFLPLWLQKYLPIAEDLREIIATDKIDRKSFSKYMVSIYDGNAVFKSTGPQRHSFSNSVLSEEINTKSEPKILDVGASDGSTSLDLIELIENNYEKYYVTDLSFKMLSIQKGRGTYFYDSHSRKCLCKVTNRLVVYGDKSAKIFPINYISKRIIASAPTLDQENFREVNLCQPDLLTIAELNNKVILKEWNILYPWDEGKVDIVKVANVLNKVYFSTNSINQALRNLKNAMKNGGLLMVIENRKFENWALFRLKDGRFEEERIGNDGSEIRELILNLR